MYTEEEYKLLREQMVSEQLRPRGIVDPRVIAALGRVPRHRFVSSEMERFAYNDSPLPIAEDQTISQPFIVAWMTQALQLKGDERVLEIGTGCGYQTAILCELAQYVYSLERFPLLADRAGDTLSRLGYENLDIHIGDGSQGLPDMKPFRAIIVTAAAPSIPGPLASQLCRDGGRLVVPVGTSKAQHLYTVTRNGEQLHVERGIAVRFVPLIGRYGFKQSPQNDHPANDEPGVGV